MSKFIFIVTATVAATMVIGVAIYEEFNFFIWANGNDPSVKFVYRFQSLIAGLFAIFAAIITVQTMQKTEEKQQVRHEDLMSLNLRKDKLIIERLSFPHKSDLEMFQIELAGGIEFLRMAKETDLKTIFEDEQLHHKFYEMANELQAIANRKQFKAASEIMGSGDLMMLEGGIQSAGKVKVITSYKPMMETQNHDNSYIEFKNNIINAGEQLEYYTVHLIQVIEDLNKDYAV